MNKEETHTQSLTLNPLASCSGKALFSLYSDIFIAVASFPM